MKAVYLFVFLLVVMIACRAISVILHKENASSFLKAANNNKKLYPAENIMPFPASEIANDHAIPVTKVATVYFAIGDYLDLNWLRLQIITHTSKNHWESLTREALRDDLSLQQRLLTIAILQYNRKSKQTHIESWAEKYASLVERWRHMLDKLRTTSVLGYTMFFVAIRELSDLTQASAQAGPELSQRKSPKKKT